MIRHLVTIGVFALLSLPAWCQDFETRVFELKARPAESTVQFVQPLLSPGGKVLPDGRLNKLIVRDTPEVIAEVEALLDEIDQHLPQVRIFVDMQGVSETRGSQVAVGVGGHVRHPSVSGTAVAGHSSSRVQSEQNLVVMSGERGVIHFARELVNADPYVQFAVGAGLLPPGFAVQTAGTGFAVEPVIVGDVVRVRITPWMSFQGGDGRSEVLVNEASSTFAVPSGQSISFSSGSYQDELKTRAFGLIFGSGTRSNQGEASVTLRPEIMDY